MADSENCNKAKPVIKYNMAGKKGVDRLWNPRKYLHGDE